MKSNLIVRMRSKAVAVLGCLLACASARAYPPAPHHTLFGMVKNQFGDVLNIFPSEVFLETPSGAQLRCDLVNGLASGINYELEVPMDSGTAADLYKPTALLAAGQFRLKVKIGEVTYLPIEMAGNVSQIGKPGGRTRLDLTLGVDSDGDGLPDAWEQAMIAVYGGTLADIKPGDDSDGDGISNLQEYLAGTYAFDPADGFRLSIIETTPAASVLEFLAIRGRTYTVESSTDLNTWTRAEFKLPEDGASSPARQAYSSTDVRLLRISVPAAGSGAQRYFKARVQ